MWTFHRYLKKSIQLLNLFQPPKFARISRSIVSEKISKVHHKSYALILEILNES